MSKALGMRCVWGLCGVLASVLLVASVARAEVSTDLSGSIVVWPKVVWTGNTSGTCPECGTPRPLSDKTTATESNRPA